MKELYKAEQDAIGSLVKEWVDKLLPLPVKMIEENRNKQNRTIKQILGHLIDSAVNNHHRIVRLQYTEKLVFPDYRQENDIWIGVQNYQDEDWYNLVTFWKYYNFHLVHIILNIDEKRVKNTWTDFEGTVESLDSIVKGYVWHLNLHINEIKELMY